MMHRSNKKILNFKSIKLMANIEEKLASYQLFAITSNNRNQFFDKRMLKLC